MLEEDKMAGKFDQPRFVEKVELYKSNYVEIHGNIGNKNNFGLVRGVGKGSLPRESVKEAERNLIVNTREIGATSVYGVTYNFVWVTGSKAFENELFTIVYGDAYKER